MADDFAIFEDSDNAMGISDGDLIIGSTDCCPECVEEQACCFEDGTCQNLIPDECKQAGGTPQGRGTTCQTVECEQQCFYIATLCIPDPDGDIAIPCVEVDEHPNGETGIVFTLDGVLPEPGPGEPALCWQVSTNSLIVHDAGGIGEPSIHSLPDVTFTDCSDCECGDDCPDVIAVEWGGQSFQFNDHPTGCDVQHGPVTVPDGQVSSITRIKDCVFAWTQPELETPFCIGAHFCFGFVGVDDLGSCGFDINLVRNQESGFWELKINIPYFTYSGSGCTEPQGCGLNSVWRYQLEIQGSDCGLGSYEFVCAGIGSGGGLCVPVGDPGLSGFDILSGGTVILS